MFCEMSVPRIVGTKAVTAPASRAITATDGRRPIIPATPAMMNAAAMIRMTAPLVRYSQAVLSRLSRLVNWIEVPPQPAPCAHTTVDGPTTTTSASTRATHTVTDLASGSRELDWVITGLLVVRSPKRSADPAW